jgi:hypothetical protein
LSLKRASPAIAASDNPLALVLLPDPPADTPLDPEAPPLELAPARDSLLALDRPAPDPLPPPPQPASTTAEAPKTAQIQRRDAFFLQTINPHPPYRLSGVMLMRIILIRNLITFSATRIPHSWTLWDIPLSLVGYPRV